MQSAYPPLNLAVRTPRPTPTAATDDLLERLAPAVLAFAGLDAREASSDAFIDNHASNRVSESLGYTRNGTVWASRRGEVHTRPGQRGQTVARMTQRHFAILRTRVKP